MNYINPAAIETCEACGKSFPDAQSHDEHECKGVES